MPFEPWNWLRRRGSKRQRGCTRKAAARHRRIFVEPLEDRSLLTQLVNVGTATDVIYNLPTTTSTVFLEDDGTSGNGMLRLRSDSFKFDVTTFANPTGSLTINRGNAADSIIVSALPDFTAGLTIGNEANPVSVIFVTGAVSLAANKNLSAFATGTIWLSTVSSDIAATGNGSISLISARDVFLNSGSSISTVDGAITVSANQQTTPTTGNFIGVNVVNAKIESTGAGTVKVHGKGGDPGSSFANQHGVQLNSAALVKGGSGGLEIIGQAVGGSTTSQSLGVSIISSVVTGTGTVLVQGTGGTGTGGGNHGVRVLNAGSTITSSGGNVQVTGQGGTGGSIFSDGVQVSSGGQISAGGNGTVTVEGMGGEAGVGSNHGVALFDNSTITSGGGSVRVTGSGRGNLTSSSNVGVYNSSSTITAGGNATVTVEGIGGIGIGSSHHGVQVTSAGASITSGGGDVQVTGRGGGSGTAGGTYGVLVFSGGMISAGGSGAVRVQGTGGAGSGMSNHGVWVSATGSLITSSGGDVEVFGIEGSGTFGNAISVFTGSITTAINGGLLMLVGNNMSLASAGSISAPMTSSVTLRPSSNSVGINLGLANDAIGGPLALTDAELDKITAGTITIGDANSSAITVSADITRTAATNINLVSGGAINFSGGLLNTAGGNLSLTPGSAASVSAAKAGTDLNFGATGTLSFTNGGDLSFAVNGTTVDTQYQQLNVVGAVDLSGVDLVLTGGYSPVAGNSFVLVNNDGSDAVIGTFNSLPEGSVSSIPASALSNHISYRGGDGNDVVLTVIELNPTLEGTAGDDDLLLKRSGADLQFTRSGTVVWSAPFSFLDSLTINGLDGNDTLTVDLSAGDVVPDGGLFYNGGDPITGTGDKLIITGGDQGTVTYNYSSTSAHDGSVAMSNFGTVNYTGLEPIVNSGTATDIVFNLPAVFQTATLGDDEIAGNGISRLSGSKFEQTDFANPTGSITIKRGVAQDSITVNALPDFTGGLTIGSETLPFNSVTFAGAIALAPDKNLSVFSATTILLSSESADLATLGSGAISLTAAQAISLVSGSSLTSVNGDLVLSANQQAVSKTGNFSGIKIDAAAVQVTGTGNLAITGRGGNSSTDNYGVFLLNGAFVGSTSNAEAAGTVTLEGTGVVGGIFNVGVYIVHSDTHVSSAFGNIVINGYGAEVSGTSNLGILLSGKISSTGPASITLTGIGGPGRFNNDGIHISGDISSAGGDITLTGVGGGPADLGDSDGIWLSGTISATGATAIKLVGTGGEGSGAGALRADGVEILGQITSESGGIEISGSGGLVDYEHSLNFGVRVHSLQSPVSRVESVDGDILIVGWAGQGIGQSNGVSIDGAQVVTSDSGSISINGTGYDLRDVAVSVSGSSLVSSRLSFIQVTAESTAGNCGLGIYGSLDTAVGGQKIELISDCVFIGGGSITAGVGTVVLRPKTDGTPINIGSENVAGVLSISDAELDRILAGEIQLGSQTSGPVTVTADITHGTSTNIHIISGDSIRFTSGSIDTADGNLKLSPGSAANVSIAKTGNDAIVGQGGTLSFANGSHLAITINGVAVDTEYEQLNVVGKVDLTGVELVLSGDFVPAAGDEFIVVKNDGEDDIIGEFTGLPDGEIFSIESGALAGNYRISYFGGDGNDVVITAVNVPPSFEHLDENYSTPDEDPVTHGPAGEFVVQNWATNVSVGPANEAGQTWEFEVSNDGPGLFTTGGQPRVDEQGTLRFTPMPNARGVANVMVVLHDDGGGTNSSGPVTFQIEITKPRRMHNSAEAGQRNGLDVTGATTAQPDGSIVAGDVLAVINYINAKGSGPVGEEAAHGPPYCDVNGDNEVAADDVIKIINYINAGNPSEGEAADSPTQSAAARGDALADLLSLLAADTATAQAKRRRAVI